MDPFFTFRALATNVEHSVGKIAYDKCGFCDTCGLDTRTQDILVCRKIVGLSNAVDRVEVT